MYMDRADHRVAIGVEEVGTAHGAEVHLANGPTSEQHAQAGKNTDRRNHRFENSTL